MSLPFKYGTVMPSEYDWRKQAADIDISLAWVDAGKVYGLAVALDDVFEALRQAQASLSLIAEEQGVGLSAANDAYEVLASHGEYR